MLLLLMKHIFNIYYERMLFSLSDVDVKLYFSES